MGLDAEAAYGFHKLREQRPWAASTRLANQAWYSFFSCTSGETVFGGCLLSFFYKSSLTITNFQANQASRSFFSCTSGEAV